MKKFKIILMALLAGLCLACQTEPSPARLKQVLTASWQSYRRHFINSEGQVKIPEEGGGTISEAQVYALLRAVWAGDGTTFVRVYSWTYRHLSRATKYGDSLLAWRWGRMPDGSWGVLDANSAADADLDYALALILAHRKGWRAPPGLPEYLEESRRVTNAILAKEVVRLPNGELLLTPGNWHEPKPPYLVNPSYFSPAAYRLFAQTGAGPGRQPGKNTSNEGTPAPLMGESWGGGEGTAAAGHWRDLHKATYPFLEKICRRLGDLQGVGLFPDWCRVDAAGTISPAPDKGTNFGWEAVRVPFRVALDGLWFKESQAAQLLKNRFLPFFKDQWQVHHRLMAVYHYNGAPAVDYESPVLYAGVLAAALAAGDKDFAREMALKILSFYREDDNRVYFEAPDNYYANNWAWLGLALYAGWAELDK
ncbi:MAG: glycosyl hydrolase family 8 [Desulfobaccales bacterium]